MFPGLCSLYFQKKLHYLSHSRKIKRIFVFESSLSWSKFLIITLEFNNMGSRWFQVAFPGKHTLIWLCYTVPLLKVFSNKISVTDRKKSLSNREVSPNQQNRRTLTSEGKGILLMKGTSWHRYKEKKGLWLYNIKTLDTELYQHHPWHTDEKAEKVRSIET